MSLGKTKAGEDMSLLKYIIVKIIVLIRTVVRLKQSVMWTVSEPLFPNSGV